MKAVSLFTGAGGMDVGFSKAGFDIVWANDIDEDSCKTYRQNHDGVIRCGDIKDYLPELKNYKGIDLVFGGPPCQGFSVAGKMNPDDVRSQLVFTFMDIVERLQPRAFVMENVKALGTLEKWAEVRSELMRRALTSGYKHFQVALLNASDFNVPQKRERMFFIGIREPNKTGGLDLSMFLERHKKRPQTVGKLLKALGTAGSPENNRICRARITLAANPVLRRSPYAGMLFNGAGRPINPDDYANTLPASMGGNKTPIVDENHIYGDGNKWLEEYHSFLMKGGKAEYKEAPSFLRRLTVDEALRIQTFPRNYAFYGRQSSVYKQIGNAVPCELAYAVGSSVKDILS